VSTAAASTVAAISTASSTAAAAAAAGSDGLWDNIYNKEILELLPSSLQNQLLTSTCLHAAAAAAAAAA
jgi:hypothetical protein